MKAVHRVGRDFAAVAEIVGLGAGVAVDESLRRQSVHWTGPRLLQLAGKIDYADGVSSEAEAACFACVDACGTF